MTGGEWKGIALRGALAILIGAWLVISPDKVLGLAVMLFGAYSIAIGLVDGGVALFNPQTPKRWLLVCLGVINVAVGVLLVVYPEPTTSLVLALVGVAILISGAARLLRVFRHVWSGMAAWVMGAAALCEMLIGVLFISEPLVTVTGFVALLGALLLVAGVTSLGAGLAMRASAATGGGGGPMRPA